MVLKTLSSNLGLEFFALAKLRKPLIFDPDHLPDLKFSEVAALKGNSNHNREFFKFYFCPFLIRRSRENAKKMHFSVMIPQKSSNS